MVSAGSSPNFGALSMVSASTMDMAGADSSTRKPALGAERVTEKWVSSMTLKPSRDSASPLMTLSAPRISSAISVFCCASFRSRSKLNCTSEAVRGLPLENTTPSRSVKS